MKNLILLTGEFPFGNDEPFLESEIKYLSAAFQKVYIIANFHDPRQTRKVPANCSAIIYPHKPGMANVFQGMFNKQVIHELSIVKKSYGIKPSSLVVKTALNSHANALFFRNFLSDFIRREKINAMETIVYAYWLNDNALGAVLVKEKFPDITVVSRAHGWDVYFERHVSKYLPYRKLLAEKTDSIFFISENGRNYFREKTGCAIQKVQVSRLGIINQLHPDFNREPEVFTIVSCSYMIPLKRIHLIIEALTMMDTKVKWVHVGFGPMENALREMAKSKLANKANVQFEFTGRLNNSELLKFYQENPASVFVNVSESEGIPVTIMEAMSFAIPVIATDVGGVREIVKHQVNGILLNKEINAQDLMRAIQFFQHLEKEEVKNYRTAAYTTWKEDYNAEKNYPAFVQQILKVAGAN